VLKVGDHAPEIDAVTSTGERFVLSAQTAICTVVYFFPKAFTPGCTRETRNFTENHNELVLAGASIVGVSTDDGETQCEFARQTGATFPLVSDAGKRIGKAYDVLFPLIGIAKRVTYVIGADRTILAVFHDGFEVEPHRDGVLAFVHAYCDAVRAKSQELWSAALAASSTPTLAAPTALAVTAPTPTKAGAAAPMPSKS